MLCENIYAYSNITYIILSLKNSSGVSYDISDATFVVESMKREKRTVIFDKMTLSKDQVLKIYFYESSGQRNLSLAIDTNDINKAVSPLR